MATDQPEEDDSLLEERATDQPGEEQRVADQPEVEDSAGGGGADGH